jgi:hypothetical protein
MHPIAQISMLSYQCIVGWWSSVSNTTLKTEISWRFKFSFSKSSKIIFHPKNKNSFYFTKISFLILRRKLRRQKPEFARKLQMESLRTHTFVRTHAPWYAHTHTHNYCTGGFQYSLHVFESNQSPFNQFCELEAATRIEQKLIPNGSMVLMEIPE